MTAIVDISNARYNKSAGYTVSETQLICEHLRRWGRILFENQDDLGCDPLPFRYEFTGDHGERNVISCKSWEAANNLCYLLEKIGLWGDFRDQLFVKKSQFNIHLPGKRQNFGVAMGHDYYIDWNKMVCRSKRSRSV